MSSSKSGTNATTNQTDNRRVLADGAISAENSFLSITNNTLDPNIVASALQHASAAGSGAFGLAGDVVGNALNSINRGGAQAFDFSGDVVGNALNSINSGGNRSFDFGSQALTEALGFGGDALRAANSATADALGFASANNQRNTQALSNVLSDSFSSMDTTMARAFSFGSQALNLGFGNLSDSQQLVADAYSDAKGRGALTDKILIGAIGAMAIVAFAAVGKK